MENLLDELLGEIIKRLTKTSDLSSLSLVSKHLYIVEAEQRNDIRVGCGLFPVTSALALLCSRFPNLCKVEFNYSSWEPNHGVQMDNKGLHVLSSCCPSLTDLTLSLCSYIDDSGLCLLKDFKKLMSLRFTTLPEITSSGLSSVAVGCKSLSALYLIDCKKLGRADWLEYLGRVGSLKELVVKYCKGISQYDFLKVGPGWMKLQKFVFQIKGCHNKIETRDPSYVEHYQYRYDFCCDNLKDLTAARIITEPEKGLGCLLTKCKALENLCLYYVLGLHDNDIITLSHNCINLRSISLRLEPLYNEGPEGIDFSTPLTDDSLRALALRCPMLQSVELTFLA
uniref:F-box domain-containing protein n=1 Tax=Arundo donax TaxID=35708 RepID=A0A0A8YQ94_ARUDO